MCKNPLAFIVIFLLSIGRVCSQQNQEDTLLITDYKLITSKKIDLFYGLPLVGDSYQVKSYLHRLKVNQDWLNIVDTVFDSQGKYQLTAEHYHYGSTEVALINSYNRNPFEDSIVRFSYFVVIGKIHVGNSFRIINSKETYGSYIISTRDYTSGHVSKTYFNSTYDDIKADSLMLTDYGICLSFEKSTKFLKSITFRDSFFQRLAPLIRSRFKKVTFLNDGKQLVIE